MEMTLKSQSDRPQPSSLLQWLPDFFRQELAPYPGRWSLVSRMVIAAVVTMLIIVTFRIPYGSIGVNCAFILSRENLLSTAKSGFYFILAFAIWVLLTPVGARMFASIPITHFFWEAITVFLCFYALKAITYFPLAAGIAVVATGTLAIWYLPGPAELNVELTLWQILATAIGAVVTVLVEVVFHYFHPTDPVRDGLIDRIHSVEHVLNADATAVRTGKPFAKVTQYAVTGSSILRQQLARRHDSEQERTRWNTVVSLVGRAVDLAAAISTELETLEPVSQQRLASLALRFAAMREAISTNGTLECDAPPLTLMNGPALLGDLETTASMLASVLARKPLQTPQSQASESLSFRDSLLVSDAFTNPDYLRFALVGTAASMLCYVIYVGLNWPGISTAVTTCVLTALSDIGSSRQKQILRIGGAAFGGFVFGVGSQIFVLPYIDSVVGLALLFAFVTGVSAYVATSSARLSYAGLQMAFAFYLINVTDFSISLDLTIGRDRAIGVLLGIGAMWLVFETLYERPAGRQMVLMFVKSARLIARLEQTASAHPNTKPLNLLRDQIAASFTAVNAESDAVLFETGPRRDANLAARERVRDWLPTLRSIYLLELSLLPLDMTDVASQDHREVDSMLFITCAATLNRIADTLEAQAGNVATHRSDVSDAIPSIGDGMASEHSVDMHQVLQLTRSLEQSVMSTPVFQVPIPS